MKKISATGTSLLFRTSVAVLLAAVLTAITSGCNGGSGTTTTADSGSGQLNMELPRVIRQASNVNENDLTLEVSLNNEPLLVFAGDNETGQWSMRFDAPQFSSNTLSISWFIQYETVKLLIATQENQFTTTDQTLAFTTTGEYQTIGPGFDHDGDGASNLSELNAESDPLTFENNIQVAIEPALLNIPASCAQIGSDVSEPGRIFNEILHQICVDEFSIGRNEVTFDEYDRYTLATGKTPADDEGWGRAKLPAINVSYTDATDYARWLSEQTGKRYRLPTEAEWELAARAGTSTAFNTGNQITVFIANYNFIMQRTTPVGAYAASEWGLFDTHGNVAEWTCSSFSIEYTGGELACETEHSSTTDYSYRGGSWRSPQDDIRSAQRRRASGAYKNFDLGFRLALDP